jgi:muramoyltetrapeptide carboxypeptidase
LSRVIRIIKPANQEKTSDFSDRLIKLKSFGYQVEYDPFPSDPRWPFTSGKISDRSLELNQALSRDSKDILFAARGGYGTSDLLASVDWEKLKSVPKKTIVGFSDISALLSAAHTKLGWNGIHGPMLGSNLWTWGDDVELLLSVLSGHAKNFSFPVEPVNHSQAKSLDQPVTGRLFGGCFSVLTNLIGTPYIPSSLSGRVLFIEDIGENPGRLIRFWNQWEQSQVSKGLNGIILGNFSQLGSDLADNSEVFFEEFSRRCRVPVWHTKYFGHAELNYPMPIGANIVIHEQTATWSLEGEEI